MSNGAELQIMIFEINITHVSCITNIFTFVLSEGRSLTLSKFARQVVNTVSF